MSYDKFGQLSEVPAAEGPKQDYSAWREEAEHLETRWREQETAAKMASTRIDQILELLKLTTESYELAGKSHSGQARAEVGQALRSIAENQNILRSLEGVLAAAEAAKAELELDIKKLRSLDSVYDKLVAKQLGEQKPEKLN